MKNFCMSEEIIYMQDKCLKGEAAVVILGHKFVLFSDGNGSAFLFDAAEKVWMPIMEHKKRSEIICLEDDEALQLGWSGYYRTEGRRIIFMNKETDQETVVEEVQPSIVYTKGYPQSFVELLTKLGSLVSSAN